MPRNHAPVMTLAPLLTRGELAERTGCHLETVRYYEKAGLLAAPPRAANGYRLYGPAHEQRLRFILRGRDLGFTLDEVRALLGLAEASAMPCAEAKALASTHLAAVRRKIAALRAMQTALSALIGQCDARGAADGQPGCPLIETLAGASAGTITTSPSASGRQGAGESGTLAKTSTGAGAAPATRATPASRTAIPASAQGQARCQRPGGSIRPLR